MSPRARTAPTDPAPPSESPDPGGWFTNTGTTPLLVLAPGRTTEIQPGVAAELPVTPTHRDLRPATEAEIQAAQPTSGQEQQ